MIELIAEELRERGVKADRVSSGKPNYRLSISDSDWEIDYDERNAILALLFWSRYPAVLFDLADPSCFDKLAATILAHQEAA